MSLFKNMIEVESIIKDLIKSDKLNKAEKLAVALSVIQELRNGFLEDYELIDVNRDFSVEVSHQLIRTMGSRYI